MSVISALQRLLQENHKGPGQPGLQETLSQKKDVFILHAHTYQPMFLNEENRGQNSMIIRRNRG